MTNVPIIPTSGFVISPKIQNGRAHETKREVIFSAQFAQCTLGRVFSILEHLLFLLQTLITMNMACCKHRVVAFAFRCLRLHNSLQLKHDKLTNRRLLQTCSSTYCEHNKTEQKPSSTSSKGKLLNSKVSFDSKIYRLTMVRR